MKKLLLLLVCACATTRPVPPSAQVPTWKERFDERVQSGDIRIVPPPVAEDSAWYEVKNSRLPALYRTFLPRGSYRFFARRLAPAFWMPTSQPVAPYYNTSLIEARGPGGPFYFRPVDTTTDCQSGCAPVVFHLEWNTQKKIVALHEEPDHPLQKAWHKPWDKSDKDLALKILKEMPEALRRVEKTRDLVDEGQGFPPQTRTFFKPFLVPGAAYTTYRLYEAALKTEENFNNHAQIFFEAADWITRFAAVREVGEGRKLLEASRAKLSLPVVRDAGTELALWLWESQGVPLKELQSYFSAPDFQQAGESAYCRFQERLLASPRGRELLVGLRPCGPSQAWAGALAGDLAASKKLLSADPFSPAALDSPWGLLAVAAAAKTLGEEKIRDRAVSEIAVRFPRWPLPGTPTPSSRSEAEARYRAEWHRSFLPQPRPLPPLPGKSSAPLLVFFASWCPHCRQMVKSWVEAQYSPEFWKRLRLIEVLTPNPAHAQEFCRVTGLSPELCARIERVEPGTPLAQKLRQSLGLYTVPRLVWTDGKGQVLIPTLPQLHESGRDLEKVLELLSK